jgi:hypothetical protein
MNAQETRRRGLNFVRRQIAAGKATDGDLEQWEKELGPEVREIAKDAAPPRAPRRTASRPAITEES